MYKKKNTVRVAEKQIQEQEDNVTCFGKIKALECYWYEVSMESQQCGS